jgi:hypothetical protein
MLLCSNLLIISCDYCLCDVVPINLLFFFFSINWKASKYLTQVLKHIYNLTFQLAFLLKNFRYIGAVVICELCAIELNF